MSETKQGAVCPICNKPADKRLQPFCSQRCADVDLGRWFTGQYALAAPPDDDESERAGKA